MLGVWESLFVKNSSLFIFTQVAYLCLVDFFFIPLWAVQVKERLVIYDRPEGAGGSNSFFVCLFVSNYLKKSPMEINRVPSPLPSPLSPGSRGIVLRTLVQLLHWFEENQKCLYLQFWSKMADSRACLGLEEKTY